MKWNFIFFIAFQAVLFLKILP